jgi:hypothetical protein
VLRVNSPYEAFLKPFLSPTFQYHWPIPVAGLCMMALGISIVIRFHVALTPAMGIAVVLFGAGELLFLSTFADSAARLRIPKVLR